MEVGLVEGLWEAAGAWGATGGAAVQPWEVAAVQGEVGGGSQGAVGSGDSAGSSGGCRKQRGHGEECGEQWRGLWKAAAQGVAGRAARPTGSGGSTVVVVVAGKQWQQ